MVLVLSLPERAGVSGTLIPMNPFSGMCTGVPVPTGLVTATPAATNGNNRVRVEISDSPPVGGRACFRVRRRWAQVQRAPLRAGRAETRREQRGEVILAVLGGGAVAVATQH